MQYLVVGPDGKEYGPATADTLKQWVAENRLSPQSQLRDFNTGQMLAASSVPGLFPPVAGVPPAAADWSQPPAPAAAYPGPAMKPMATDDGKGELWGALFRAGLALLFFFVFHGLGVIFAIYALVYAFQANAKGNRFGIVAIVVCGIVLLLLAVGWFLRFSGTGSV
ncbi:MAG: hypothetical protein QOJ65_756 [Fimbriimonadaceae bacterium]|jgi:hypothetical protein|nr:hypothetical protein [Fimbriimonadaceae bacterium]